ncbi:MAG: hypothetical protein ACKOJB_08265, partial [Chthoniobacterales bacterium]
MSVVASRVQLGDKPCAPERIAEASALNRHLTASRPFAFVRLGDFDLSLLEGEGEAETREIGS